MHFWDPYNVVFIHSHTIINLTINSDENKRIVFCK